VSRQLYADLPAELHEADEILNSYGRWANRGGGGARCGSAEGMYRAPQDDEDRKPRMPLMAPLEVDRCREALGTLPMMTLLVIQWLYVDTSGLHAKMRKHGIQPRHMRERHLDGVRLFWLSWKRNEKITSSTIAFKSNVVENACT